MLKKLGLITLFLASASHADVMFQTGQVLTANQLNNAFSTTVKANDLKAANGAANVGFTRSETGAVARTLLDKLNDDINAKDFGAKCDGINDDTIAFQDAINTGKTVKIPSGTCVVTSGIITVSQGQVIKGEGRKQTIIKVPNTFNRSAKGVFISPNYRASGSNDTGPQFRDFKITFEQPDIGTRSGLYTYPPAFYLQNSPRFEISNVQVSQATNIVDMRGDSGGAFIDNLEGSSWGKGIMIDGSTDTVRIARYHFWPFDVTTNQYTIWNDNTQIALESARMDDLQLVNDFTYKAAWKFTSSGLGSTWGVITGGDLDTGGNIQISAGAMLATGLIISSGDAATQAIVNTGGNFSCSSCSLFTSAVLTKPLIQMSGANANTLISNSYLQSTVDNTLISASGTGTGSAKNSLTLTGNQFTEPTNTAMTKPIVDVQSGSIATISANRVTDIGTGTGTLLNVATDDYHSVTGNTTNGWQMTLPTAGLATYLGNGAAKNNLNNALTISDSTGKNVVLSGSGASKTIGVNNGSFQVLNGAGAKILSLDDNGNLFATGSIKKSSVDFDTNYVLSQPASGATVTMPYGNQTALIMPSATLESLTITLPACYPAYDGAMARYSTTQAVTSVTVNTASGVVAVPQTTLKAGEGHGFICRAANSTWYPLY